MAFVHPVIGTVAILFTIWIGSRGITARQGTKGAHQARRIHRKYAVYALIAMVVASITGTASTVWLRDDLSLGDTWHLAIGWVIVGLMGVSALLTRYFTKSPVLRSVHPLLGMLAVAAAVLQAIIGIELLP
ncbi:MAG: DUF4079 family protein [Myxococcota bacterium]